MKNKIIYWGISLFLLLFFSNCGENDNWGIVTDVQPGIYVAGSAVVYKTVAPAAAFKTAALDGNTAEEKPGMFSMYTWLKAGGEFYIVKADDAGVTTNFGKGAAIAGHDKTNELVADGTAYTVAEDGLYCLIYNNGLNQLTVVPAKFGVIGGATAGGWDSETLFTTVAFKEASATVEFTGNFVMAKNEMKFRFNNGWGIAVPYDAAGTTVTVHTNQGSIADADGSTKLNSANADLKAGGKNLAVDVAAPYDVTLKLDLRTGKFSVNAIQGEAIIPTYPENLYMIGGDFGNWNWADAGIVQLVPVHSAEGAFWCISYFTKGTGFKWAPVKDWKGDFTQLKESTGYTISDGNAVVAADGLYTVYIDMKNDKIAIEPAKVYGIGDCFGDWDAGKHPFTISGGKMSITTTAAANLRMYAGSSIATTDWWSREFNIFDGKIIYRGAGGDQAAVATAAGKTVTLDFKAGAGEIK